MPMLTAAPATRVLDVDDLALFAGCPRRFDQPRHASQPGGVQSIEAFADDRVHDALAWFLSQVRDGRTPAEPALVQHFDLEWTRRLDTTVRVVRAGDRVEAFAHRAQMMLRRFHAAWNGTPHRRVVTACHRVRLTIGDGFELAVTIDLVARVADGPLQVFRFDTGLRTRLGDAADPALRLRAGGIAVLVEGRADLVLLVHQPLFEGPTVTEPFSRSDGVRFAGDLARRIATITRAADHPAAPSAHCAWCAHRDDCDPSGFRSGFVPLDRASAGCCPKCGDGLGVRNGRVGAFIACARHPDCRYTRDL
jgi:hypothetical protein